jgi:hypothetical protein
MPQATRRRFFGVIGATPLAAKAAIDAEVGQTIGMAGAPGLGNASIGLSYGAPYGAPAAVNELPYENRIIGATEYIKLFGLPEVVDFELRDRARIVCHLDPDIANKRSWSMSVKIMTQRQRNYDREVARLHLSGWRQSGFQKIRTLLGFNWPY